MLSRRERDGAAGDKHDSRRNRGQVRNGASRPRPTVNRMPARAGRREFRPGSEKEAKPANGLHRNYGGRSRVRKTETALPASFPRKKGGAPLQYPQASRAHGRGAGRLLRGRQEKRNRIRALSRCEES